MTSIGNYAFQYCSGLTSVTIGNSVTSIGSSAFYDCTGLTSVYYTGDVASWCEISFGSSSANPLYYAGNLHGNLHIDGSLVKDLVIPDSVTSIGNYAFYNYSGLTTVTIPDSVTSIGSSAFYGCSGLTEIIWNAVSVSDFSSGSNVFYNAGTAGDGIAVTFGDGVETIPAYAFYVSSSSYRPNIKSVTIGDSVTNIGESAFEGCSGLTSVYYTGDVASWCEISFGSSSANPLYYAGNLHHRELCLL